MKKFLAEQPQKEAAVPGLGVFYAGEKDGASCILFKEVSPTDKTFLNYIAFEDNISEESARAEMEEWVHKILHALKSSGNVYMDGVGGFSILADRVEFVPAIGGARPVEAEFGLEDPMIDIKLSAKDKVSAEPQAVPEVSSPVVEQDTRPAQPQPQPVSRPDQETRFRAPRTECRQERDSRSNQNDRRHNKNTFRSNPNDNRQRPANPRPAMPNKEMVLENRRGGNGGQGNQRGISRKGSQSEGKNMFTQWWFLLCCLVAVLLIVLFAIRPVRESLFGSAHPTEMESLLPVNDSLIEENVDMMLAEEVDMAALAEESVAAENEQIANEVIAGQVQREKAEAKAKQVQSKPQARPAAKPAVKPAAKPAAKPQSQQAGAFAPQAPVKGKFYIIVGSFANKTYAQNKYNDLKKQGQAPSALYVADKDIYYISVKTCATRSEAIDSKAYFRDQKKMDCWIFEAK